MEELRSTNGFESAVSDTSWKERALEDQVEKSGSQEGAP